LDLRNQGTHLQLRALLEIVEAAVLLFHALGDVRLHRDIAIVTACPGDLRDVRLLLQLDHP
jgi:hypothetical protein